MSNFFFLLQKGQIGNEEYLFLAGDESTESVEMRIDPLSPPPLGLAMTLHGRHGLLLRNPLLGPANRSLHELTLLTVQHQRPASRDAIDPTKIARERTEHVEKIGPMWKTRVGSVQSHVKFRSSSSSLCPLCFTLFCELCVL